MATKARAATGNGSRSTETSSRTHASFHLLRPARPDGGLSPSAEAGVAYLQFIAGDDDELAARGLWTHSIRRQSVRTQPFLRTPPFAVLNRRKRAARLWVNAILSGDVSAATLRNLTLTWLPQLAGTGPDAWRAAGAGRSFVEYLRGHLTASVLSEPMECLLRHAKALHALESILAIHLGAIVSVPRPTPA